MSTEMEVLIQTLKDNPSMTYPIFSEKTKLFASEEKMRHANILMDNINDMTEDEIVETIDKILN